jgi:hypothetical protein
MMTWHNPIVTTGLILSGGMFVTLFLPYIDKFIGYSDWMMNLVRATIFLYMGTAFLWFVMLPMAASLR